MASLGDVAVSSRDAWAYQDRVNALDARFALASVLAPEPGLDWISYRSGVFVSGDSPASSLGGVSHMGMKVEPGAGMTVTVEAGNCVIDTPSNGPYMCTLGEKETLTLNPSSAVTNRIDVIVARVQDDENSAIGSPADVRQFSVEVWEGDPATGDPVEPDPNVAAGWIKLAAVSVPKNATNVTADRVWERRGPGLNVRGGLRMLFGDDAKIASPAFLEPGAYPGDQRFVVGNDFPHQIYYGANTGSAVAGWRGVHNAIRYKATPNSQGVVWTKGRGAIRELCRVNIPYPGTPYAIRVFARANFIFSPRVSAELRVSRHSATGELLTYQGMHTFGLDQGGDHGLAINAPMWEEGPYTAGQAIVMNAYIRESVFGNNYGVGVDTDAQGQHVLQVVVVPATIEPAQAWR